VKTLQQPRHAEGLAATLRRIARVAPQRHTHVAVTQVFSR
jgi:hypothetical protein